MIQKEHEKIKAIELRNQGLSYSEILSRIPVAKSTLSLWLRSIGLSKRQRQRLTEKKLASIKRGWAKWHQMRLDKTTQIKSQAVNEISNLNNRDLMLIGAALYWAEGTKEKEHSPGINVQFSNSDALMIKLFLQWLLKVVKVDENNLKFDIYIHENSKNRINDVINYWSNSLSISSDKFKNIYFKKNKINSKRKNRFDNYFGLIRLTVRKSSSLNRKLSGYVEGMCKGFGLI